MKIICVTVGKKHDPLLAAAIQEYEKRLHGYVDFSFDYVPVSNRIKESGIILTRVTSDDLVLLLDETGALVTNSRLTTLLDQSQLNGVKRILIIIGGPYGVDETVKQRSQYIFSLSGLVFPHQIVRLLVVEQLYRSYNTLVGGKYHHN